MKGNQGTNKKCNLGTQIYVKNLPYPIKKKEVERIFLKFGPMYLILNV